MANSNLSLVFLSLLFLLLSYNSGGIFRLAHGQAPGQESWCMAKTSSLEGELTNNINYVCVGGYADCSIIQQGGPCFNPNTNINHASVVMNLYYQKAGRKNWTCDFTDSAVVTVTDPSYGDCKFVFL